jgi:glycosyltransferase involved in cell wall biosynthesis
MLSYDRFVDCAVNHKRRVLLKKFDGIIAVSKAIPLEMGDEWINRVVSLDPGVSLDKEDLSLINMVRSKSEAKRNYIIFGGRPLPLKGLIEGLLAFKYILREFPDLKMIVTGKISEHVLTNIIYFCRKLGIKDKVIFTGFLSRKDRFGFINKSKLMLYPSHFDAFPYAVCESLHLGTPVVAYKIPALEVYYERTTGVKLVEEGNIEALATEAINMLKSKTYVEKPKMKRWNEIMNEEILLIERMIGE